MKLRYSGRTDVGRTRDHNEDCYGVGEGDPAERLGKLLVVCDGAGGHASGEIASRVGVDTIIASYYDDPGDDRPAALSRAVEKANAQIYAQGHGNMLTTSVAALLHHDALHVANVGDSRAYLIRKGTIRQVSRDHSLVSDQVAAGLLNPEDVRSSPIRNVITRALGYQSEVEVDMFRLPLQVGDIVVLSSDGLHGQVTDEEIAGIATERSLEDAAEQLIQLANERGGPDNITVVLSHVDALDWDAQLLTDEAEEAVEDHDRITIDDMPAPAPSQPPQELQEQALGAPRRPAQPVERRLNLRGGLLSLLLLMTLIFLTLFALNQPAVETAPLLTPSPVATAPATTGATASPAGTVTPAPSPAPTSAGTATPTARP